MFKELLKMNRFIKLKQYYFKIVWILYCSYKVLGCTSTTAQYKQIGDSVTLQFQATTTNSIDSSSLVANIISLNNGSTLLATIYRNGILLHSPTCTGCIITGNAVTGDLSIRLDNLQTSNGGTYQHSVNEISHETKGCIIVYILGKPEKPTIQANNNNSIEGMNIQLTCMSRSTTYPSDPNLSLQYDWRVDTEYNPQEYEYSQIKNILTIKNLDKQDAKKRFTCNATQSGPSVTGLISNYSDEFMINVFYGPSGCEVSAKSPVTVKVGTILPLIKCRSECSPKCTYKWTNASSGSSIVSANGDFEIDSVTRYLTGNYKCECGNSATEIAKTHTEILEIIAWYIEFGIEGYANSTDVTVSEYDTNIRFICKFFNYKSPSIQIIFNNVLLNEQHNSSVLYFTRESVTCFDAGVYTCQDNSKQETWLGSSIRLFVKCAPRPLQKVGRSTTSSMYVPITLSFTTLAYPEPGPKGFLWHKEDEIDWIPLLSNSDIQISSSGLQSNITIFNVSLSDYGTYRLTVTNEVGIYKQMIRLVKKDSAQKELVKESDTEGDAYNSWMIVGIVFGFLAIAIGFYATGITFLWRKAVSKGAREPTGEITAQTTYVNTDVAAQHVEVDSTQDQHITEAEFVNLYTDLAHYSKDDRSTYEVLKGN